MAYANIYRRDRLFLPQQKLLAFARDVPTPFFLYDEDGIRKTARLILGSFRRCPGHRAYFPISANNCPAILRLYRKEGFGALARSLPELALARECGFSDILFHTAAMTAETAAAVMAAGCGVIFDAPGQIELFSSAPPARCLLRYFPERELRQSLTGIHSRRGKSGMSREQVIEAAKALSRLGIPEIGLHCHLPGCDGSYPSAAGVLLRLAAELKQLGVDIRIVDPGGGLSLSAKPGQPAPHLSSLGARVAEEYADLPDGLQPALYTEFGRCAIARHGILLSRVAELRERLRSYAILDMSAAQFPRIHGAQRISVVGNCAKSGRRVYYVYGCTPDAQELICDRAILPPLSVGTLVALHESGAYRQSIQASGCMLPSCGGYLFTCGGEIVPLSEHE